MTTCLNRMATFSTYENSAASVVSNDEAFAEEEAWSFAPSSRPAFFPQRQIRIVRTESNESDEELKEALSSILNDWLTQRMAKERSDAQSVRTSVSFTGLASASECVEEAMLWLSLNATQAAQVFRVSRQTIYAWRDGQALRDRSHRDRVAQIRALVKYWKQLSNAPVGEVQGWADTSTGQTLLALLAAPAIDVTAVQRHLDVLHKHLLNAWAKSESITASNANDGFAPIPERWRREMHRDTSGRNIRTGKTNGL